MNCPRGPCSMSPNGLKRNMVVKSLSSSRSAKSVEGMGGLVYINVE